MGKTLGEAGVLVGLEGAPGGWVASRGGLGSRLGCGGTAGGGNLGATPV